MIMFNKIAISPIKYTRQYTTYTEGLSPESKQSGLTQLKLLGLPQHYPTILTNQESPSVKKSTQWRNVFTTGSEEKDWNDFFPMSRTPQKYKTIQKKSEFQPTNRSFDVPKSGIQTISTNIRRKSEEAHNSDKLSQKVKRLSLFAPITLINQHQKIINRQIQKDNLKQNVVQKVLQVKYRFSEQNIEKKKSINLHLNAKGGSPRGQRQPSMILIGNKHQSKGHAESPDDIIRKVKNHTPTGSPTNSPTSTKSKIAMLLNPNPVPLDDKLNYKIANLKDQKSKSPDKRKRSIITLKNLFKKKTKLIIIASYMQKVSNSNANDTEHYVPGSDCSIKFQAKNIDNILSKSNRFSLKPELFDENLGQIPSEVSVIDSTFCSPKKNVQELNFIRINRKLPQLQKILQYNKSLSSYAYQKNPQEEVAQPQEQNIGLDKLLKKKIRLQLKFLSDSNPAISCPITPKVPIYTQQRNIMESLIAQIRKKQTSCHSTSNIKSGIISQNMTSPKNTQISLIKIRHRKLPTMS